MPAPSGIRAVGLGLGVERRELDREGCMIDDAGDVGERVEAGEMGFILNPLTPGPGSCGAGSCIVGGGPGTAERGVGGRIFSRWS